jgi:glycosyltransferase involved in cell wall biosynthesis
MSISVVIPAYKAATTIRRAVESVIAQTSAPAQILIVDDGSPDADALIEALGPFGSAVTLLQKANGGASSARNYGIEHARGDWVAFIDADDYWEPEKLARQLAIVRAHPEVSVVGCRWFEEIPGQPRTPAIVSNDRYCGRVLRTRGRETFELACSVWTGSLLVRRSSIESERFITGLEPAEDRDLWVRLFMSNHAFILPDFLATYVQEPGGISRSDIDRDCSSMLKVVHRHAELLGPAGVREREAIVHRQMAAYYLFNGQPAKALPPALRRLRLQPKSLQAWWIVFKASVRTILSGGRSRRVHPAQ